MPASDVDMHEVDALADDQATQQEPQPAVNIPTEEELAEKYPNRPHNHSTTLPFRDLFLTLFNPLGENKKRPAVHGSNRRQHRKPQNPNETRRHIIEKFIKRWRTQVGNDIYPAFRLIVPEKDRDRPMYNLKEKAIAKLLIKIIRIDPSSEAGHNLLNWKLPGVKHTSSMAGDFAGRCYEVLADRAHLTEPGNLTIEQVNTLLDRLAGKTKEEEQIPIFTEFYQNMNREELMWLIRIILRQMKVGASEKTLFDSWHPDAENLFNVSSSLRRVCWELYDENIRLNEDDSGITIMQCFQPQLAQFQGRSIDKMVQRMQLTDEDPVFWIEEKLDGERMQLHMVQDESKPGGFSFAFWSRKAKDYTYLYGNGFQDPDCSLTRHLRPAFHSSVRNIVLDGEMISWDMQKDVIEAFGHLKTAALAHKNDVDSDAARPVFKVFDCLYLNDQVLTNYTLRDRRKALESALTDVHRRLEIHPYIEATSASEVEPLLRKVIAESTEGLVLKNPRSTYRLNQRNDDWMKVKPEYMTEFGESLDCVVIGGYYGSGHRGGIMSSYLCGLRVDHPGANPELTYSVFKVGGGFTAHDYADIAHRTDNKWKVWDKNNPPSEWIELDRSETGVNERQVERPDVWIKPSDSVVLSVKAASIITGVDNYRVKMTLRFPRFKALRADKDWKQSLSVSDFVNLKGKVEHEQAEKELKIESARKNRVKRSRKKVLTVIGADDVIKTPYAGPATALFNGMSFYIITGAAKPLNKSKAELEQLVKANGGKIVATHNDPDTICIGEGNPIRVASIKKKGERNIFRPQWLLDCIKQAEADAGRQNALLPFETSHVLFGKPEDQDGFASNVDEYGDSFARDVEPAELERILESMLNIDDNDYDNVDELMNDIFEDDDILDGPGCMFRNLRICVVGNDPAMDAAKRIALFAGATLADEPEEENVTHVVTKGGNEASRIRNLVAMRSKQPHIVTAEWVTECLKEGTWLDEEKYTPT